jgi:hypothetical protein
VTSRFWEESTDFDSCLLCLAWIYGGSHIFFAAFRKLFVASLCFVHIICLDIWYYHIKNDIIRIIRCSFVVINWRRSQGWTIILSLHLCLVTFRYIRQLLKCQQSVTRHCLCRAILLPTPHSPVKWHKRSKRLPGFSLREFRNRICNIITKLCRRT